MAPLNVDPTLSVTINIKRCNKSNAYCSPCCSYTKRRSCRSNNRINRYCEPCVDSHFSHTGITKCAEDFFLRLETEHVQ